MRATPVKQPDQALATRYAGVRALTDALAAPLSDADATVQSMDDASPPNGIWRIPHGSSKPSSCAIMFPAIRCTTNVSRSCSTAITRPRAAAMLAGGAAW